MDLFRPWVLLFFCLLLLLLYDRIAEEVVAADFVLMNV